MSDDRIQDDKFVSLTYTIEDVAGNTLEHNDLPVSYIHGGDQELIGGMDRAVKGKCAGETVSMELSPEQGFGAHDASLTFIDDLKNVPEQFHAIGAEVRMQNDAGETKSFYVTKIENGKLTVDGNHPFAGKALRVKVKILEVRDATEADRRQLATQSIYH